MTDLSDLDPTPKPKKYRILDPEGQVVEECEAMDLASVRAIAKDRKIHAGWTIERQDPDNNTWVFCESFGIQNA